MSTLFAWASSSDTLNGSTIGAEPSVENAGSYGERLKWPASTAALNKRANIAATTDMSIRAVYTLAAFAGSSHTLMFAYDASTVQQWKLDMSSTGTLRIRDAASAIPTGGQGTVALALNTEYKLVVTRVGTTLTVKAYKVSDGTLVDTISGTVGGSAVTIVAFGNNAALTGTLGSFTYDQILITSTEAEAPALPLAAGLTVSPSSGPSPLTVTATATSSGGTGTAKTYAFAWGDGATTAAQSSATVNHTYSSQGEYDVVVTVLNT